MRRTLARVRRRAVDTLRSRRCEPQASSGPPNLTQGLTSVVAMPYESRPDVVLELLRDRCPKPRAFVFVPIDGAGNESGPPLLRFASPSGPALN